ncbi:hypothetical protein ACFY2W_06455 [Streptomyces sp. NPDC001262]|uniref:hypothetical protein n=1 Tax=Streptomyces TaxID=1883 RepID=UPI0036B4D6B8
MARHLAAAAAHDMYVMGHYAMDPGVVARQVPEDSLAGESFQEGALPAVFEGLSVPIRTAASLLGLSPWTVAHLIERGELVSERGGQYRYVTLTSIFSYRRRTR